MKPQIIYLLLVFTSLIIAATNHGKVDTKPKNIWYNLVSTAIVLSLLYWGNFFDSILK